MTDRKARLDWALLLVVVAVAVALFTGVDIYNSVAYGYDEPGEGGWAVVRIALGASTAGALLFIAYGIRRARRLRSTDRAS